MEDIDRLHSFVRKEENRWYHWHRRTEVPDIPFISLQDLLSKRGIQLVFELLGHHLERKTKPRVTKKFQLNIFKDYQSKLLQTY